MSKKTWITWEIQIRNRTISKALGAKLFEFPEPSSGCKRFLILTKKTYQVIKSEDPQFLFVQNPSIVLTLFALFVGISKKKCVTVDAHNVGIHFEHKNRLIRAIGQFLNILIIKKASVVLVSNSGLADYVRQKKGRPFILPDPFPEYFQFDTLKLPGRYNILYICTFSEDEPYRELIKAAELLDNDCFIYVSGNYRSAKLPGRIPSNVRLTGYLSEQDYINYLHSADLIIDLTSRNDCLVCGAYEAIGAGKPMLLSDKKVLREYFGNAALYTDNSSGDIAAKIRLALKELKILIENAKKLKFERSNQWYQKKRELETLLSSIKT